MGRYIKRKPTDAATDRKVTHALVDSLLDKASDLSPEDHEAYCARLRVALRDVPTP